MTIPIIVSVLAGMAIGLRFKVLMIMPAIFVAALSTAAIMIAQGDHAWTIILATVSSAVGVQIGYLCGTFAYSVKETKVPAGAPSPTVPADAYRSQTGMGIPVQFLD